jgi:hypothetical protein
MVVSLAAIRTFPTERPDTNAAPSIANIWNKTVSPLLKDELWRDTFAYDAGHALMVPLHASFRPEFANYGWVEEFVDFFSRLAEALDGASSLPGNATTKQQFLYLVTQGASLLKQTGRSDLINEQLLSIVAAEQEAIWNQTPAWQWDRDDFPSMRDRIAWKLSNHEVSRSYYRAIVDEELFNFALAADLRAIMGSSAPDATIDAVDMADQAMAAEGLLTDDDGWLFQPGVYWQHPDYAYAGHIMPEADMEPMPVRDIASDTSHAHRLPKILDSLMSAADDPQRKATYVQMRNGLSKQFFREVLVDPDSTFHGYRTTNYLDGHNGLYRWEYETQGENNGYLPYELSGTMLLGWWAFLSNSDSKKLYRGIASNFPLAENVIKTYVGPNTSRDRHLLLTLPNFYINGFAELVATLAAHI